MHGRACVLAHDAAGGGGWVYTIAISAQLFQDAFWSPLRYPGRLQEGFLQAEQGRTQ